MNAAKHLIRLNSPAKVWEDGLPLGNGRLGAMILGKPNDEIIIINEETLWYGKDKSRKNPDTKQYWKKIRTLLTEGKYSEAQFLAGMAMTSTPKYNNPYQPAGDLKLRFYGSDYDDVNYERRLDIDHAIAGVSFEKNGISYHREHFVSGQYQVFVTKLTGSQPGSLTVCANMNRKPFEEETGKLDNKTVYNRGRCGDGGISYFTGISMDAINGEVGTIGDCVYASHADVVYIYLACNTDYADPDYQKHVLERLEEASKSGFDAIKEKHISDYESMYRRMSFSLAAPDMPDTYTDDMLTLLRTGNTKYLSCLTENLFAYARYLLISSSTNCLFPANLQGIWNGDYVPSWQSQYTININEEMNYWMAEKCNLTECHLPVMRQIGRLAERGRKTARELYDCGGFCAHHNTNIWDSTDPEGIFDSSPYWPMGGAWLCLHLYDHYLYSQDKQFLKEYALPIMREAIRFFEDYLYERADGYLVTGPSLSPENSFCLKDGAVISLCMGPAMDSQILRQLITSYQEGCKSVGFEGDSNDEEKLQKILDRLMPINITEDGRIMEWMEEQVEAEPGHRHLSHLFALHPGTQISAHTPELFEAARRTLETRLEHGGGQTGWSRAWTACMEARLKNGTEVGTHIKKLLELSIKNNLLDTHPPFQIDGNLGFAEAVCEALMQSHNGYIEILPALPPEWADGEIKGMILRGAITADFKWAEGSLTHLCLTASEEQVVELRYQDTKKTLTLYAGRATQAL